MKLLCFGITKDIIGQFEYEISLPENSIVLQLRESLEQKFPDFKKLTSLRIAVNNEYADENTLLKSTDEVVLIPPVSGG